MCCLCSGRGWFRGRQGRQLSWGLLLGALGAVGLWMVCPMRGCAPRPQVPHFSCQGVRAGAGVLLSDITLSLRGSPVGAAAGAALEALPRWQQMEEASVTFLQVTFPQTPPSCSWGWPCACRFLTSFPLTFLFPSRDDHFKQRFCFLMH